MAAITQIVPNLMGGVSQQPDPIKIPGQVREAKNVFLDPTFGCKKRPPTKFIGNLATGEIPADAQWFPIMRDQRERYVACIYKDQVLGTVLRVWEADTATERIVNLQGDSADYLAVTKPENIKTLTINDYTLVVNKESVVTMADNEGDATQKQEALVVVNQVAYNTSYTIDFLKDGNLTQEKVYKANKLSVTPGSFEEEDDGACGASDIQTFVEDGPTGQTGLGFTLKAECNPTLVTEEIEGKLYPTALQNVTDGYAGFGAGLQAWATLRFGSANEFVKGSYLYHTFTVTKPAGDITVRVEVRVESGPVYKDVVQNRFSFVSASVTGYTINDDVPWSENAHAADYETLSSDLDRYPGYGLYVPAGTVVGMRFKVSRVSQGASSEDYKYTSKYKVKVTLQNGGQDWRVGDEITVTMSGKDYTIKVEEETFGYAYQSEASVSYTTKADASNGALDVSDIVSNLVTDINNLPDYSASPIGNVIHILRDDGRDFNIQTRGGTADNALKGIKGAVNDISVLPEQCVPGVVLKVRNSADSTADDYYVKFISSDGDIPGQGSWEETVSPGIPTDLNPGTMPHALIREANGDFTFRPLSEIYDEELYWSGREVGDKESNPDPSFVGKTITDVFFYMNRLGFLSVDTVVMSQPGDYFNFFQTSAISVSDADPIDMSASSTKPATLKAAIGTTKGLLLFAENSQFLMSTNEAAFGPATVKINEIGSYSYNTSIVPIETGVSVMFASEADTYTKVFEMAVDSIDNRPIVSENTRIIPEYIPPGLRTVAASPNNSFVMFGDNSKTLYTFKFYNTGNERNLAGWSKWEMPCDVRLVAFDHDTGYMVMYNNPFAGDDPPAAHVTGSNYYICKFEMLDDPYSSPITVGNNRFTPRLDNYLLPSELTTEEVGDVTRLRFPEGAYVEYLQPNVIVTVNGEATLFARPVIQSDPTGYYVEVPTNVVDEAYILGLEYNMSIELPSFWLSQDSRPDRKNLPIVETCYIDLYLSGRYEVVVNKLGYDPVNIDLDVTISDIYKANQPAVEEVITRAIPVFSRGDYVNITISSPDPLPSAVTGYSWEGHYSTRGINKIR